MAELSRQKKKEEAIQRNAEATRRMKIEREQEEAAALRAEELDRTYQALRQELEEVWHATAAGEAELKERPRRPSAEEEARASEEALRQTMAERERKAKGPRMVTSEEVRRSEEKYRQKMAELYGEANWPRLLTSEEKRAKMIRMRAEEEGGPSNILSDTTPRTGEPDLSRCGHLPFGRGPKNGPTNCHFCGLCRLIGFQCSGCNAIVCRGCLGKHSVLFARDLECK